MMEMTSLVFLSSELPTLPPATPKRTLTITTPSTLESRPTGNRLATTTEVPLEIQAQNPINGVTCMYKVSYDDTDEEDRVTPARMRPSPDARLNVFEQGQEVEANWWWYGVWYPAVISEVLPDGTYSVLYDDGQDESQVPCEGALPSAEQPNEHCRIRPRQPLNFAVDDEIEARWMDFDEYYPGVIVAINGGAYSIDYYDGHQESNVPQDRVRALAPCAKDLQVNDEVHADWYRLGDWYEGTVEEKWGCTYVIRYKDGSVENHVPEASVELYQRSYSCGDRVQANYFGDGQFYPGEVCQYMSRSQFYKICYDDGTEEVEVEDNMISSCQGDSCAIASAFEEIGDQCVEL